MQRATLQYSIHSTQRTLNHKAYSSPTEFFFFFLLEGTFLISIAMNVLASASSVSSFLDNYWYSELSTEQGEL